MKHKGEEFTGKEVSMYRDEITDNDIMQECKTFRDSLRMSWRRSGKTIEQIALCLLPPTSSLQEVSNMVKNLSRIINPRSPEDKRNLDGDMLIPFMAATGNSIPLRWLNIQFNPAGRHVVTTEDLQQQIAGLEGLFRTTMAGIYSASRRSRVKGLVSARMSVAMDNVPLWLMLEMRGVTMAEDSHA